MNRATQLVQRATIGIITALPKEFSAVAVMLESPVEWSAQGEGAGRRFMLGEIPAANGGSHVVALALLTDVGTTSAAISAINLLHHFPNVRHIVMCGIAGGIPLHTSPDDDVRLGDLVVSDRGGVVAYDFIKQTPDKIEERHPPRPPGAELTEAVRLLDAKRVRRQRPWESFLERASQLEDATRPQDDQGADGKPIEYPADPKRLPGLPRVFYGPIASADRLLKDSQFRDALRERFKTRAVEMEGSGVADATWSSDRAGYLVVRGICDFCDMRKGDFWQGYAAIAAAAYVRALLESMPASLPGSKDSLDQTQPAIQTQTRVTAQSAPALTTGNAGNTAPAPTTGSAGNTVLFDIYEPRCEPYYLEREIDQQVRDALAHMSTWVSGPAGVGKTTAIRHALYKSRKTFAYISFSNCFEVAAHKLLLHAYIELAAILKHALPRPLPIDTAEIITSTSALLAARPKYDYLYIDELPTEDPAVHGEFTRAFSGLVLTHARRAPQSPLRYVVSSIHSAIEYVGGTQQQLFERVRFVQMEPWAPQELQELANIVVTNIPLSVTREEIQSVLASANGSPRFVKSCLRKFTGGGTSSRWPIERIISETSGELL